MVIGGSSSIQFLVVFTSLDPTGPVFRLNNKPTNSESGVRLKRHSLMNLPQKPYTKVKTSITQLSLPTFKPHLLSTPWVPVIDVFVTHEAVVGEYDWLLMMKECGNSSTSEVLVCARTVNRTFKCSAHASISVMLWNIYMKML